MPAPTDDELCRADRITLVDPRKPGWRLTLHARIWNKTGEVIDIEVDSNNAQAVNAIVERVRALRPPLW